MSEPRSRSCGTRSPLAVSVGLCVLVLAASTPAKGSEIDRLQIDRFVSATRSQSTQGVLDFINTYPFSPLISDLLSFVSPEVAQQVCAEPLDDVSAVAQDACKGLPWLHGPHEVVRQLLEQELKLEKQLKKLEEQRGPQGPHATLIAS